MGFVGKGQQGLQGWGGGGRCLSLGLPEVKRGWGSRSEGLLLEGLPGGGLGAVPQLGGLGEGACGFGGGPEGFGGASEGELGVFRGLRASPHVEVIDQGLGEAGGGRDRLPAPPLCAGNAAVRAGGTPKPPRCPPGAGGALRDVSVWDGDITLHLATTPPLSPPLPPWRTAPLTNEKRARGEWQLLPPMGGPVAMGTGGRAHPAAPAARSVGPGAPSAAGTAWRHVTAA